jgi:hypothetical protein
MFLLLFGKCPEDDSKNGMRKIDEKLYYSEMECSLSQYVAFVVLFFNVLSRSISYTGRWKV